jgi:hypothetical protein
MAGPLGVPIRAPTGRVGQDGSCGNGGPGGRKSRFRARPGRFRYDFRGVKKLGLAFPAAALVLVAAGCLIKVAEPRQREDWTISPIQYGDTRYGGLRAPRVLKHPSKKPRHAEAYDEGDAGAP